MELEIDEPTWIEVVVNGVTMAGSVPVPNQHEARVQTLVPPGAELTTDPGLVVVMPGLDVRADALASAWADRQHPGMGDHDVRLSDLQSTRLAVDPCRISSRGDAFNGRTPTDHNSADAAGHEQVRDGALARSWVL